MSDIIQLPVVLVLNRSWQAIHVKTPAEAFCMMATGAASGLDIDPDGAMRPVLWTEWLTLPVREHDRAVKTVRGELRVPTVIVSTTYARVPMRRRSFSGRSLWERDGGVCQYTGRSLKPGEGNIDHVVPRSRGGRTDWENCVLAHREVNSRKADKTPDEAGLKLLRQPAAPKPLPATVLIRNTHSVPDWEHFLV